MAHNPAYILLAIFLPIGFVGAPIAIAAILSYHRRQLRFREQSTALIQEMLAKKMPVEEIERIMAAWQGDARWTKQMVKKMKRRSFTPATSFMKAAKA